MERKKKNEEDLCIVNGSSSDDNILEDKLMELILTVTGPLAKY